ncbi:MAG: hypothetical protein Ct9H300mP28_08960 [Pseudomonadota bacterium]|nr:MAG: hypothetical protein Ct9H300mP28_08960 [Pseudomonadota bacterium]
MDSFNQELTEDQRLMKQSCRDFIDRVVSPFLREDWQRNGTWILMNVCLKKSLRRQREISIRTLGVPEKYGGIELNAETENRSFAIIAKGNCPWRFRTCESLYRTGKFHFCLGNLARNIFGKKWFTRLVEDHTFLLAHCLTEPKRGF